MMNFVFKTRNFVLKTRKFSLNTMNFSALDDWEFVMYDAAQASNNQWTCLFFMSWILVGVYIILNVLTILILSRFLSHSDEDQKHDAAVSVAQV